MAWAHVQSRAATGGGSGTTQALAFTGNTTTGNAIVVAIHSNVTTRTITSITDSQGNAYTATQAQHTRASHGACDLWVAKNITGGTTPTVTVTFSGILSGISTYVAIHEYSGLDTTSPVDLTGAANGTGTAPTTGNLTGTTAAANELGFGFLYAGGTGTAGAGFTSRQTVNGDITEDKDTGASGSTFAAAFTQTGGASPYIAMAATFKVAAGATDATVNAVPVTMTTAVPAPTVSGNGNATVNATPIAVTAAVPAPAPSAGATVGAAPVAVTAAMVAPAGFSSEVSAAPIVVTAAVPAPQLGNSANATVSAAPIAVTTTAPAPAVSAGSTVSAAPVAVTVAVPAPVPLVTTNAQPVVVSAAVPAPAISPAPPETNNSRLPLTGVGT